MPTSITGTMGWALALVGLAGAGAAGATKILLERSNARQLEACQKQIGMLQLQIKQTKEEREDLDRQLPPGGGPIDVRLQAAEEELAALEELTPLNAKRQAAQQEAGAADRRARDAETELAEARRRWRESLQAAGLPANLSPKQVRDFVRHSDQLVEIRQRIERRREELQQRRREFDALAGRIAQLAADTGVAARAEHPLELLHMLARELGDQEVRYQRRQTLRDQARQLRRKQAKHDAAIRRLKYRRRDLFRHADTEDEQQFRQRALQQARAETLRRERASLQAEIDAAIGGFCPEETISEHLGSGTVETLQARWDELAEQLPAKETELRNCFEQQGRLNQQLKALAEDRRPAAIRLELGMVEKRLDEAIRRWQVLAVTSLILDSIRETYERERQPETLQEASGYLKRLTRGRYHRVWTPLGRDELRVDDAQGRPLSVEVLSRGTREQLFLSLRLALASSYARRGAQLPLVLDDVLVNFDTQRAKAAVAVLHDFTKSGHQLLVFTCHEHIMKLFKAIRVETTCLPDSEEIDVSVAIPRKKTRKQSEPSPEPAPRRAAAELDVREPEHKIVGDEIVEEEIIDDEIVEAEVNDIPWEEADAGEVDGLFDEEEEDYTDDTIDEIDEFEEDADEETDAEYDSLEDEEEEDDSDVEEEYEWEEASDEAYDEEDEADGFDDSKAA